MTMLDPNLPVSVKTDRIGLVPVTSIFGEIDIATEQLIKDEIHAQLAKKPDALVLDLSSVTFMGSAGVNLLVQSEHEATRIGARLTVIACEGRVRQVLAISGIDDLIELHPDIPSALRTT